MKIGLIIAVAVLLLILALAGGYLENRRLVITRYEMRQDTLPKAFSGCKIAFLSDLHSNQFGRGNERLKKVLEQEKPDLVLVGGDMLVGKPGKPYDVALNLVSWIKERFPMEYAMGNHEHRMKMNPAAYGGKYEEFRKKLEKEHIVILDNEKAVWEKEGEQVLIYGVTIGRFYYKGRKAEEMTKSYLDKILGTKPQQYTILLAHNPNYFPTYAEWGADLVLAGHNHGGIARLPFLGGVIDSNCQFFPKYDVGRFQEKSSTMLLSAGLGSHTLPFRFFNPPELLMIELCTQAKK